MAPGHDLEEAVVGEDDFSLDIEKTSDEAVVRTSKWAVNARFNLNMESPDGERVPRHTNGYRRIRKRGVSSCRKRVIDCRVIG
jgi:hypothetical protein